jgi:hypothetical protein
MNPEDFFTIAERIFAREGHSLETSQISCRTALNRLYYGVLHCVKAQFVIHVPDAEKGRYHAFVKDQMRLRGASFWRLFVQLEDYRVRADYFLDDEAISEKTVDDARDLKETIMADMLGDKESRRVLHDDNEEDAQFYAAVKKDRR